MLDAKKAHKALAEVIAAGKKLKGAEVLASLVSERTAHTRFARNEITTSGEVDDTSAWVQVAFGTRHAMVSTNQTDAASLKAVLEKAARLAKLAPEDPEWMKVLGAQKYAKVKAADKGAEGLDAQARADAAATVIKAADEAKVDVAGFYNHVTQVHVMATSAGLKAEHRSTYARLRATARTTDATGSGWAESGGFRAADVNVADVARMCVDKAVRSAKPQKLEAGKYTVVLEPAAVAELVDYLGGSLDARSADEGRSAFSKTGGGTKVGETILPETITLTSDPTDANAPGSPFDGEGLALAPMTWIEKGVLKAMVYGRYWADKQGKTPTGGTGGLKLAGGTEESVDALVKGVKRGVLITRFWYTNLVDPTSILVTGLTRDGTFLIENGQITGPVNNFRFNDSPLTFLKNATGMTKSMIVPYNPPYQMPAIRSDGFNLASISEAV